MTDLYSLGYPQGYRLGLSFVLWIICIAIVAALGVFLYLKARKSDLINVKEMFRAKSFLYICSTAFNALIQVGVFFPDSFLLFSAIGYMLHLFSLTIYYYYWEKNLTSIKRIPTVSTGVCLIITIINLFLTLFFPDFAVILEDFLVLIGFLLVTTSCMLYIYLIHIFSKNVKGGKIKTIGWAWMGSTILSITGVFLDSALGVKMFPEFIVLYAAPIIYTISMIMPVYAVNKLFVLISSFYTQTQRCAVHRGAIGKGNPMYSCPSCGIVYCMECYNQVIKKDGCWNCREGANLEIEKKWVDEPILELKKADKPK